MSGIAICTDSTALFPLHEGPPVGVTVVPVAVVLEGEPYVGDDPEPFYERLSAGASATTSTPSPGEFLDAYALAAEAGADEVLSIHVDARLSATIASAELAARDAPVPVTVVDSGTVSFGLGMCVSAAAAAVSEGASTAPTVRDVRRLGRSLRSVFVAPSAPRGRAPGDAAWAVFSFAEGVSRRLAACDSPTAATELMAATILSEPGRRSAAVGHASVRVEPWADALAELLGADRESGHVARYRLTEPVGAHTGPLCFGAFWWSRS